MVRSLLAAVLVAPGALVMAPPAAADEAGYLKLRDQLTFLSADQLLSEGRRVCAATSSGRGASDTVNMVRHDLGLSAAAATDIVATAIVQLNC